MTAPGRWPERVLAAATVAMVVLLALYFPDRDDGSGAVLGSVFTFGAVAIGLAAIADVRPLERSRGTARLRLLGSSLLVGVGLGVFNLIANYAIASLDFRIRQEMINQWTAFSAWSIVFAGPMIEEIAYRLVLMSGVAWLVSQVTPDRRVTFLIALTVSSLLFGVAHILPSSRPTTGVVHATGVAVKSSVAGVVLGWVFWRRGLPYSTLCHGTANAVHLLLWPALF